MWNPLQGWLADFECQDFDFMSSFSLAPLVHGSSILNFFIQHDKVEDSKLRRYIVRKGSVMCIHLKIIIFSFIQITSLKEKIQLVQSAYYRALALQLN